VDDLDHIIGSEKVYYLVKNSGKK